MTEEKPTMDNKPADERTAKSWRWPLAIALLLAVHATMWIAFVFISTRDPSFAVEPDYYRKSLAWDETIRQDRASSALGWSVAVETETSPGLFGDRGMTCRVTDREGKPLTGATVEAEIFHHARASQRHRVQFRDEGTGVYSARPRMRKPGLWECRVTVRCRGATFTCTVLHPVRSPERRTG